MIETMTNLIAACVARFDDAVSEALFVLDEVAVFQWLRLGFDAVFAMLASALAALPWWLLAAGVLLAGWRWVGRGFALAGALGLALCEAMSLWTDTMATLALVLGATVIALMLAIPLGVLAGLSARALKLSSLTMDFIQTLPAYIYLLPGIALLGYGPATAMAATILVAMAPALRLTAHGVYRTPLALTELATALGTTRGQALMKVRIPSALAAMMAGVNQSLMLAFGMVVIAGVVGSGGLGQVVYEAVRTLQIARSIDAGIAIVVLSIVLDRLSQRLVRRRSDADG